jgi:phosphatidylserine/phosphatidylglycerophosphate/cardiolipin synthase-like enzyme
VRAKTRGVKVHIMARPPHTLKKEKIIMDVGSGMRTMDDVGIKIHKLKHLKLHGKMLLADGLRAIVGSINLAPGSFDDRQELAIERRVGVSSKACTRSTSGVAGSGARNPETFRE